MTCATDGHTQMIGDLTRRRPPPLPPLLRGGAEGIDLLVLGSRGYGPVMRVLLGSVSGHVFRHAPCPLLVTRRP